MWIYIVQNHYCANYKIILASSELSVIAIVIVIVSAFFNYDNYAASEVLLTTTLSLHSFMRSSQAESIIAAVS